MFSGNQKELLQFSNKFSEFLKNLIQSPREGIRSRWSLFNRLMRLKITQLIQWMIGPEMLKTDENTRNKNDNGNFGG